MISPRLCRTACYAFLTSNVLQQKVTRSSAVCTPLTRLHPYTLCEQVRRGDRHKTRVWQECLPELKGAGLGTLGMEGWPGEAAGAGLAMPKCCSKAAPPSLAGTGMRPTAAASCMSMNILHQRSQCSCMRCLEWGTSSCLKSSDVDMRRESGVTEGCDRTGLCGWLLWAVGTAPNLRGCGSGRALVYAGGPGAKCIACR